MDNRRTIPRLRTFLSGKCVFNGTRSAVDCRIRDMTATGARLEFGAMVGVPNEFMLEIPSKGQAIPARAQWRSGLQIGVSFPAPAP